MKTSVQHSTRRGTGRKTRGNRREDHMIRKHELLWSYRHSSASVKSTEEKEMMSLQLNYARKELKVYDDTV